MIQQPQIANLMNFGYEFHVLMMDNPTKDIKQNANHLIGYINYLKGLMPDNKNQFVVIGESMGGLIARYALSFMETPFYTTDFSNPAPERMHNTRLYISIDVPNQGANVPLAFQQLYDKFEFYGLQFGNIFRYFSRKNKWFLDATAAKQMLIYHIDTKNSSNEYFEHPERTNFKNDLANIGNYPVHLKKVALTNGLMSGAGQSNFYDMNRRIANDKLVFLDLNMYVDFLWFIKVPLTDLTYALNSNPNGSGSVYFSNYNTWDIDIQFYWFGVSLILGYLPHTISENATNVKSYCTSPGGYFITGTNGTDVMGNIITNSTINPIKWPEGDYWYSGFFSLSGGSNGAGCWLGNTRVGFGGFCSANIDADLCSDGANFCFIPTISALDYTDNTLPQPLDPNYNIEANSVNHILNHTPFDVVVGIPNQNGINDLNEDHLNVRMALHDYACNASNTGQTLQGNFLNREIGDDYFYLDNTDLSYEAEYEAQNYIYVNGFNAPSFINSNDPNPNARTINIDYNYDGIVSFGQPSMYSKSNIFVNTSTANFYDNNSTFMYPKDGYYWNNPFVPLTDPQNSIGLYNHFTNTMVTCCTDYSLSKMAKPIKAINKAIKQSMILFPNPAKPTDEIMLNYTFLQSGKGELKIMDMNGKVLYTQNLNIVANASSQTSINTAKLNLASGLYVVVLSTGNESNFVKLLIN